MSSEKSYLCVHPGHGRVWHLYEGGRSLCGKSLLMVPDEVALERGGEMTAASTSWQKGQDCKACFRRAGLLIEKES